MSIHLCMVTAMTERLTKTDWIRHGLRVLASEGQGALKVGPMATTLKVSRGSFYWHFKDMADFEAQILSRWQEATTEEVIRQLETGKPGPERLKHLMQRAFGETRKLDRAIRGWAANDGTVAAIVASVDSRRVDYIAGLLAASGVAESQARSRATFMYWAYLGQATVMEARHATLTAAAMDDISGLFERG